MENLWGWITPLTDFKNSKSKAMWCQKEKKEKGNVTSLVFIHDATMVGSYICARGRTVTSLGHQGGEEFSERGPNFLNYVQHSFPGGRTFSRGVSLPCALLVMGLARGLQGTSKFTASHWLKNNDNLMFESKQWLFKKANQIEKANLFPNKQTKASIWQQFKYAIQVVIFLTMR